MEVNGRRFIEHRPLGGYGASINTIPRHTVIIGHCLECDRAVEIDRDALPIGYHHAPLFEIEKALKCQCGKKAARILAGYFAS